MPWDIGEVGIGTYDIIDIGDISHIWRKCLRLNIRPGLLLVVLFIMVKVKVKQTFTFLTKTPKSDVFLAPNNFFLTGHSPAHSLEQPDLFQHLQVNVTKPIAMCSLSKQIIFTKASFIRYLFAHLEFRLSLHPGVASLRGNPPGWGGDVRDARSRAGSSSGEESSDSETCDRAKLWRGRRWGQSWTVILVIACSTIRNGTQSKIWWLHISSQSDGQKMQTNPVLLQGIWKKLP